MEQNTRGIEPHSGLRATVDKMAKEKEPGKQKVEEPSSSYSSNMKSEISTNSNEYDTMLHSVACQILEKYPDLKEAYEPDEIVDELKDYSKRHPEDNLCDPQVMTSIASDLEMFPTKNYK
jgi:hypothetical protein